MFQKIFQLIMWKRLDYMDMSMIFQLIMTVLNGTPLYLSNFSKDYLVDNVIKTGFYCYVYGFSVSYYHINIDDILDIHKYLMVKNNKK